MAVALFCGTAGAELGQQLVDHNTRFWDAAAAVLQAALAQPAHFTDSIEALDAWSVDTGKHSALALAGPYHTDRLVQGLPATTADLRDSIKNHCTSSFYTIQAQTCTV